MSATQPALGSDRLRMLALMDIDVYVRRVRCAPLPPLREAMIAEPAAPAPGPSTIERGARAPAAAVGSRIVEPLPARVVFATGSDGGFADRYGALLRGIALALGVDPRAVDCGEPRDDLPCVCFGTAPGATMDVVLAPPLAALRASGAARRALWASLRPLARRLGT